ncbi:MAG TPA: PaaI family thioesterase [Azospirillum sp.]|nr:PaaI family thioesterase [Azospirillum sp.]
MTREPDLPLDHLLEDEAPSGFQDLLGYRLARWEQGVAEVELLIEHRHLNRAGVVHGGVLTTLLDTAMGFAATYCPLPGRVRRVVTLSVATSFLGQARHGTLVARGTLRGGGRKIVSCAGEVLLRETGAVLAAAEGMFKYRSGHEHSEGVEP